jgi:hypothetical protein
MIDVDDQYGSSPEQHAMIGTSNPLLTTFPGSGKPRSVAHRAAWLKSLVVSVLVSAMPADQEPGQYRVERGGWAETMSNRR